MHKCSLSVLSIILSGSGGGLYISENIITVTQYHFLNNITHGSGNGGGLHAAV